MPIHLSLALTASALSDIEPRLAAIKDAGFEALDLPAAEADRLKPALDAAGLKIACLNTDIALHARSSRALDTAYADLTRAVDAAITVGAPTVRLFGGELARGETVNACIGLINKRLEKTLAIAARSNITLAVQNAGGFLLVKDLWSLLETINNPRIGACLDIASSMLAGESPVLTVPTLNSRIVHVRVWDFADAKPMAPGAGTAKLKLAFERLRGIAYDRFVGYAPSAELADDASLKSAAHQLKLFAGLIQPEPPKAPEPAKPAGAPAAATKPAAPAAAKPASPAPATRPAAAASEPAVAQAAPAASENKPA